MTMFAVSCLLCLCFVAAHAHPPDEMSASHIIRTRSIDINNAHELMTETRLNNAVEPTYYRLQLTPRLDVGVFSGQVFIEVTWLNDSNEITIHCAHDLEITEYNVSTFKSVPIVPQNSQTIESKMTRDPRKPTVTLFLNTTVAKGTEGVLHFKFRGTMETATTEGFFKTTYTEQEEERIVAGLQLRPTNARRVFPCFDEPHLKARFQLNVLRPKDMVVLSSAIPLATTGSDGKEQLVRDHFQRTPPISTYSLGLVIAKLELLAAPKQYTDIHRNNFTIRVWGRPEFLPAMEGLDQRVFDVVVEIACFWQSLLPLQRLDIVALPNYQGVKPADGWGLILFKESDLANRGVLLLAQEICYQWLGGYASPAWWSDAHINKALVGFIAAETALRINNGAEMEGKWPMTALYSLYYEFSKRYPHSRITGMKQETVCTKMELLLCMFNDTLGPNTFREGLRRLVKFRTGRVATFTTDDVWDALTVAAVADNMLPSNMTVKTIADSWISKDRLPFISVRRDYKDNVLSISQSVFLRERPHDVPNADNMRWWVPIVVWRDDEVHYVVLDGDLVWANGSVNISTGAKPEQFVIVNPEELAPYPVNYDLANWRILSTYLQSENRTQIPELTRAKLLHDAWNLAFAGELSFATALNMTLFLRNEKHHLVWDPIFTMIDHLGRHTWSIREKFQVYIMYLLLPLYEELVRDGVDDEETWRKNLRSMSRTFLCQAGWKPCIDEARLQFSKWMESKNPDAGNPIANQYICPVFKYGTEKEWEFGLQRVINFPPSRKQSERTYLLKALAGCPVNEQNIRRILNVTVLEENENFTDKDIYLVFSMLAGNNQGYTTLISFLSDNWDVLKEKLHNKTNLWDFLIASATSHFTTEAGLQLVSNLYSTHKRQFGSAQHIIEKSLRNIKEEAAWSSANLPVIESWLDAFFADPNMHAKRVV